MEVNVTYDNFKKVVLESDKPVLVDFWATWCGPCQMLGPVLAEIAKEREDSLVVAKVNVDEEMVLAGQFGVESIPMVLLINNGEYKSKFVGYRTKADVEAFLDESLS